MHKEKAMMLVDGKNENIIRVASIYNNALQTIDFYENLSYSRGSIHLGIITRVLPSLQAVFVKYKETGREGFLPFSEIDRIYFSKKNTLDEEEIDDVVFSDSEISDIDSIFSDDESEEDNEENDDDDSEIKAPIFSKYNQGFISKNQIIMVQIVKEERDTKGAMLSTFITLQGRYCSYMPNRKDKSGISRNAFNAIDRRRLEVILKDLKIPAGGSVVISSSGVRKTSSEIKQDFNYLIKLWGSIKKSSRNIKKTPEIIYQEENAIRNIFNNINSSHVSHIVIEGEKLYRDAIEFARSYASDYTNMIKLYNLDLPIFSKYKINDQINNLFSNIVSLRSGGYIVIDKTEALISVDVNSGKNRDELCIEETALRTNIEAIQETMNQIKLRKMSGLIVVDLIGMRDMNNNRTVENLARRTAQYDKSKTQISYIIEYSLMIISRQRTEQSLFDVQGVKCEHCHGRGFHRAPKFIIANLFDDIKSNVVNIGDANFNISTNSEMMAILINEHRDEISDIERNFNCKINFICKPELNSSNYNIERIEIAKVDENSDDGEEVLSFDDDLKQEKIIKVKPNEILMTSIANVNELNIKSNNDKQVNFPLDKNQNRTNINNNDPEYNLLTKVWDEWLCKLNNN